MLSDKGNPKSCYCPAAPVDSENMELGTAGREGCGCGYSAYQGRGWLALSPEVTGFQDRGGGDWDCRWRERECKYEQCSNIQLVIKTVETCDTPCDTCECQVLQEALVALLTHRHTTDGFGLKNLLLYRLCNMSAISYNVFFKDLYYKLCGKMVNTQPSICYTATSVSAEMLVV